MFFVFFYLKTLECKDINIPALHFQLQINLKSEDLAIFWSLCDVGRYMDGEHGWRFDIYTARYAFRCLYKCQCPTL